MELFITVEGQNCTENGMSEILSDTRKRLEVLLQSSGKYGSEFVSIAIIPTCIEDSVLDILGWKERVIVRRKQREADIRLRIDYNKFVAASREQKQLLFANVLVRSIRALQKKSKQDFDGELLVQDVLIALDILETDVLSV